MQDTADALTSDQVLSAVDDIRRKQFLSYQELAAQISKAAGEPINHSVLLRAFNKTSRKPHDRTIDKCRRFLDKQRRSRRRKR